MEALELTPSGLVFAQKEFRATHLFKTAAVESGKTPEQLQLGSDLSINEPVFKTNALSTVLDYLTLKGVSTDDVYEVVEVQAYNQFEPQNLEALQKLCALTDVKFTSERVSSYVKLVECIDEIVSYMEQKFDFYPTVSIPEDFVTQDVIKGIINNCGLEFIQVRNINMDLKKDPSAFSNGIWAVQLVGFLAALAFQLITVALSFYVQTVGATSSDVTNLTAVFNCVQLFFSPILLSLSDRVGRKPIFAFISLWYALTTIPYCFAHSQKNVFPFLLGFRAMQGLGAIIAPLAFTMVGDLAVPKVRGFATICVNIFNVAGSAINSAITIGFSNGKRYSTVGALTDYEIGERSWLSFRDTCITASCIFFLTFLLCLFVLPESHPRIIALKNIKKMGCKVDKTSLNVKQFKQEPILTTLRGMVTNWNLILIFVSYIASLIGSSNSKSQGPVFVAKMYGFTSTNEAKSFSNLTQCVGLTIGMLLTLAVSKFVTKKIGETRMIIVCQCISYIESLLNFFINPPINRNLMYFTMFLVSIQIILCDSLFLAFASMFATPQNRGSFLGIFQIGNSVGRTLSAYMTGQILDYNIRDTQMVNTFFLSLCLITLSFVKPPIDRRALEKTTKASAGDVELK